MVEIVLFNVQDYTNLSIIPIHQIELDSSMLKTLEDMDSNFDKTNFIIKNRVDKPTRKLSRMERILKGMNSNINLPPVVLKMYIQEAVPRKERWVTKSRREHPDYIPTFTEGKPRIVSYSVEDGRHRVVGSIINNFTHVPAELTK